jgi:hypothetical protein
MSPNIPSKNHRKTLSRIKQQVTHMIRRMQGKKFVHFLHIGKTGGTVVKHALEKHLMAGPHVICLHPHDFRLRDVPRGELVFFFLRDPISRFASGFYSRQRQGKPRYFTSWSPNERLVFERFVTPNQLAIALSSPDEEEARIANLAMTNIRHFASYWDWFENEKYLAARLSDIFFIGFQNRLNTDFDILKSKLGLPEDVRLSSDEVLAHRNPPGLDTRLTDEAVKNLKRWYARDEEFITFCERIIREHPEIRDDGARRTGAG